MENKVIIEKTKEQEFDFIIQHDFYYNEVYTYLLQFKDEFTNNSLMDFIINCKSATHKVKMALCNYDKEQELTIKYIIEQNKYYETILNENFTKNYKLNEFELYLTKFIVAHHLVNDIFLLSAKDTIYFNQIWSITKSQNNNFKYYFEYHRGEYGHSSEDGFAYDWHLRLNTEQYVHISKNELKALLEAKETQQNQPPQKQIEPIKWLKDSVLLAYLINELKQYGFIDESNIWAICEQIFVDKKGKPIKAETFTSMVKNYENNQTTNGTKGRPKSHAEITELIKTLKDLSKELL